MVRWEPSRPPTSTHAARMPTTRTRLGRSKGPARYPDQGPSTRRPGTGAMAELLGLEFMRQALMAAVLVGLTAPMVGVFLVQRRMSLIGDGMGHVALAGVAVGVLTGAAPVLTALVAAVAAAVLIEVVRARGRTSGDV